MYNFKEATIEYQDLSVLWPDDLAAALFRRGDRVFRHCMFGRSNPASYWEHVKSHCPWFRNHSARNYEALDKLVPISLYGDDVNCYRNSEVGTVSCVAWTPDLAYGNATLLRYFPICIFSEHCTTMFTHEDIMKELLPRLKAMCDTTNIDFDWSEQGYAFVLSSLQGDLKWVHERYNVHDWRSNKFCSLCACVKDHPDPSMTITDFRMTAHHVGSSPDLSNFNASRSCIFEMEAMSPSRILHDCMHSQLLGTGKVGNASAIIWLAERQFWGPFQRHGGEYGDCLEADLKIAHKDFMDWKKSLKLTVSQPRFTCARLNRRHRGQYAALSCKAAASKAITMWVATRAVEHAQRPSSNEDDRLVAVCMHSYASMLQLMSDCNEILSDDEAERFFTLSMTHLQAYGLLRKKSAASRGKAPGRQLWLVLPKHHFLMHVASTVRQEKINPKTWSLFCGEDFIGRLGRMARVCHRQNLSQRVLQRYLASLHLELEAVAKL